MTKSRWTLMLVPHDNERVRSFQVSLKDVRAIVSAVLMVAFLLGWGLLGASFVFRPVRHGA